MSEVDFTKLYLRLREYPEQSLTTIEGGRFVVRPYPELCDQVETVMSRLETAGIKAGMRVGLLSENRYEWLLYDWALAGLDCVSVAFPEDYAERGIESLIREYELDLLVAGKALVGAGSRPERGLLVLDEAPGPTETAMAPDPERLQKRPDELSNCFSTGTAGKSKGLLISGKGTARLIGDCMDLYGLGEGDSILVFMPLTAFQQRFFTYAGPLRGVSIHLIKPLQIFRAMRELSPSIVIGPPSLFEAVYEQAMPRNPVLAAAVRAMNGILRRSPKSIRVRLQRLVYGKLLDQFGGRIRVMLCGMAKTSPETIQFFLDVGLPLYEVYGLIETGLVAATTQEAGKIGSVGKPFPGCDIQLAEDGEVLVHKEALVARGYFQGVGTLRNPHLFGDWFATGDIGSLDEQGFLTLKGRKDHIIVTDGGYKIQPEALEAALETTPHIKKAVVFGGAGLSFLTAVVVTAGERGHDLERQVEAAVEKLNRSVEQWCAIGSVIYADEPFTMENGLLNRGLKVNRKKVFERYRAQFQGEAAKG